MNLGTLLATLSGMSARSQGRKPLHPCQTCGACCAKWRVEFYWREAESKDSNNPVPSQWVEDLSEGSLKRAMKGSTSKHRPRCQALGGEIGVEVGCRIYTQRPTPCRAFQASYENGIRNPRCDEARAAHGLTPLTRGHWVLSENSEVATEFSQSHSAPPHP